MTNEEKSKELYMDRYTIYCTAEQTRKALELGAPMMLFWKDIEENYDDKPYCEISPRRDRVGFMCDYAVIPTAEQMIGWLEEQYIDCFVGKQIYARFVATVCANDYLIYSNPCDSRKEATLAAIDAALDYLSKNKK